MGSSDEDKPEFQDRDNVGVTTGAGSAMYGIDAKHLHAGGEDEGKAHRDHSWRSKAEVEPDDPGEEAETPD
jgi:hypothetical protein